MFACFTWLSGIAQQANQATVYYNTDQWQLTGEHRKTVDSLMIDLRNNGVTAVSIYGHTDNIGDSLYNVRLSQKRSNAIAAYVQLKYPDIQTAVSYYGENKPARINSAAQTRSLNRRVDILWKTAEPQPSGNLKSLKELYELIAPLPQQFCINNNRDTVLKGDEGTLIFIPANTFNLPENSSECVQITLKERYKKSLIIRDNLATITFSNEILISQAMFEIDANVPLNAEKYLLTFAPADSVIDAVKPFYGSRDQDDIMHWIQSNDQLPTISGSDFNRFFAAPCTIDSMSFAPVTGQCPFFFCKILHWTRIKPYVPEMDTTFTKVDIPCMMPAQLQPYFPKNLSVDQVKDLPQDSLKYYVFNTSRLGWRNLDWLMKIQNKTDYRVNLEPDENIDIKLIFKEYRSVIPLLPVNSYYHFSGAPVGYNAWLLAFKVENGKAYMGLKDVRIDANVVEEFNFEEVTSENLYEKLKVFDQ